MEKFLSLEWFKSRAENAVEKVLDKRVSELMDKLTEDTPVAAKEETPYLNLKLVNDILTVVFRDGSIFSKPNANEIDYERVSVARTKEEVLFVIQDTAIAAEKIEEELQREKEMRLVEGFDMLVALKDFERVGSSIVFTGTSRTIPQLLLEKFSEVVGKYSELPSMEELEEALKKDDEYQGLKNFFMWCCLNPRAEVADSLYNFLSKNGMKITKQGFFVALRNVVVVNGEESEIVDFISNAYNKVKAVWKKSPDGFRVMKQSDGSFSLEQVSNTNPKGELVGNLTTLYKDLPSMRENRYTDNWTRTFDIRIGQLVSMPKEDCNWSTQDCMAAGLHFAGHTAPYVLCGDTTVFTLHNPMKVVGIGKEKGRCWEYLPFMTTNIAEADQIMNSNDFDFLQLDEAYAIAELDCLMERAKDGFTAEASKYDFNFPSISSLEIKNIVKSLESMKDILAKRVNVIE